MAHRILSAIEVAALRWLRHVQTMNCGERTKKIMKTILMVRRKLEDPDLDE